MGGICFIMAILFVMAGFFVYYGIKGQANRLIPLALTLGLATFNGMIGFVDDYQKVRQHQNEGLTAKQKFILQLAAAEAGEKAERGSAGMAEVRASACGSYRLRGRHESHGTH